VYKRQNIIICAAKSQSLVKKSRHKLRVTLERAITAITRGVKGITVKLPPADKISVNILAYTGLNQRQHQNKRNQINQFSTHDISPLKKG